MANIKMLQWLYDELISDNLKKGGENKDEEKA